MRVRSGSSIVNDIRVIKFDGLESEESSHGCIQQFERIHFAVLKISNIDS